MDKMLAQVIEKVDQANPLHAKTLRKKFKKVSPDFFSRAANFLPRFEKLLIDLGKDLQFGVDCYLRVVADVQHEQLQFIDSGKYSSTSFDEVNARVYNNPEVMEYYMLGLLLTEILWVHHHEIFCFFERVLAKEEISPRRYLEIGGGHGLFISTALEKFGTLVHFDLVDISETSLKIARTLIANEHVQFIHQDIYDFQVSEPYDFITMGEVLEHVEDPVALLKQLHSLLAKDGHAFITAPANAAAIDHIYLFTSAEDIRTVIREANFEIIEEHSLFVEDVSAEMAARLKISLMYGALLKKR